MPPMKGWTLKQLSWSGGVPTEEKKAPSFLGKIPNPTALPTSPEPERAPSHLGLPQCVHPLFPLTTRGPALAEYQAVETYWLFGVIHLPD